MEFSPQEQESKQEQEKKNKKEKVRFSEEELVQETVLPIFDKTSVVKNRLISTSGRLELGLGLGASFLDTFFKKPVYEAHLTYHINEMHGILLSGVLMNTNLSRQGRCVETGRCFQGTSGPRLSQTPRIPKVFYGKLSIHHFL